MRWDELLQKPLKNCTKTPHAFMSLYTEPLEQEDQDAIVFDSRSGDLESLQEIFSTLIHPRLLTSCVDCETQCTPLHMAAANGHLSVVKYLLELVKEHNPGELPNFVNRQNKIGNTALHWASLNGKLEVVQLLCDDFGADPFVKNAFGHDSIFEAENNGKEELEDFFLKKYDISPATQDDGDQKVAVKEGTEIEQVTRDAEEAQRESNDNQDEETLAKSTEQLHINDRS